MSGTVHWTPARRMLTLLSWLVGIAGILYFVIPWMMGVSPPDGAPMTALVCAMPVAAGLERWVLGSRPAGVLFWVFATMFLVLRLAVLG
jgi:hypothetical protein